MVSRRKKYASPGAWLMAARPKTLTGATVPVLIASAAAWNQDVFAFLPSLLCLLFAWLMQIDANLINDLCDYLKGSDTGMRLGPERACASGRISPAEMKTGIALCSAAALCCGFPLVFYGGWRMVAVGLLSAVFAFLYSAGPYPLSRHGLGDILVLVFFGLVPVCCTYYVMGHDIPGWLWPLALSCGLVIDTMLIINNYRDIDQDRDSGKRTSVVLMGRKPARILYLCCGIVAVILPAVCLFDVTSGWILLAAAYLPFHLQAWSEMGRRSGKRLAPVFARTSANMLLWGLLTAAGLCMKFV